jgi:hypothetical protein
MLLRSQRTPVDLVGLALHGSIPASVLGRFRAASLTILSPFRVASLTVLSLFWETNMSVLDHFLAAIWLDRAEVLATVEF